MCVCVCVYFGVALGFNVMPLGPGKYLVTVLAIVVVVVLVVFTGQSSNNNGSFLLFAISSSLN